LAHRSFALHARLAAEIGGDWGYRRLTTYGGCAGLGPPRNVHRVDWLSASVAVNQQLGSTETLRCKGGTAVAGVEIDGEVVEGDAVVIALGPWSMLASQWLPIPAVFGLKGHSLVFETGSKVPAEALFLECREASGAVQTPELFPRADGTTYVCAIASESPLPTDPARVTPDPGALDRLRAMCSELSPVLATARILARQACYRPITRDGLPLIGPVAGVEGAYIATGHGVWGILNAPATGEAMAELIVEGAAHSVDLSAFDPARLPPFDAARLRFSP
jgi:glycine/D-amino acid oxidase-like deaminating enzyme